MYRNKSEIILASGSPRRQEYLREMGLNFTVRTGVVAEQPHADEKPDDFVIRMALEKAAAVSSQFHDSWVISGDTVVCLDKKILGKPVDEKDALSLLLAMSGREHRVISGLCVANDMLNLKIVRSTTTFVRFDRFSESTARAYVATGEWIDKAGGYGIQGKGACLVESIDGSYSNVVGLPLCELMNILLENNVIEPALPGS